ncbi:MAG TPA: helix-turn-helix domain-containing protein [Gammaproteobacteria bacterium]|nr:helix-turn-helix domain-containing protein [Gammaproteobacteria bacterium]
MLIRSPKELALLVSNQRKRLKLSQAEVGKLVGLKQQTISEFEIKPDGTKLNTLFHILSAVNLDIRILTKDDPILTKNEWKEEW